METNEKIREWLKNQHPDDYRRMLKIEEANKEAMEMPKDEMTLRLESLGFRRIAVTAMSDTHYFSSPCDKNGESTITVQKGEANYSRSGEVSIRYEQGVDVWKSCGHIFKEGFYTLEEFDKLLQKMEKSRWYREKKDAKTMLPELTILQRNVYDALPITFPWAQGKDIAINAGMPSRTAQRFFGKKSLFHKVKNGIYVKRIIYSET